IVVLEVQIEVGMDQLILDELPDDPRHLIAVHLDDAAGDFDLLHVAPPIARQPKRRPLSTGGALGKGCWRRSPQASIDGGWAFGQPWQISGRKEPGMHAGTGEVNGLNLYLRAAGIGCLSAGPCCNLLQEEASVRPVPKSMICAGPRRRAWRQMATTSSGGSGAHLLRGSG